MPCVPSRRRHCWLYQPLPSPATRHHSTWSPPTATVGRCHSLSWPPRSVSVLWSPLSSVSPAAVAAWQLGLRPSPVIRLRLPAARALLSPAATLRCLTHDNGRPCSDPRYLPTPLLGRSPSNNHPQRGCACRLSALRCHQRPMPAAWPVAVAVMPPARSRRSLQADGRMSWQVLVSGARRPASPRLWRSNNRASIHLIS